MNENEIGTLMLAAAIEVHHTLGPGLLESVCERVPARELSSRGLAAERQVPGSVICKELRFEEGFRADLIVEDKVLAELKSTQRVTAAQRRQVPAPLRLTGLKSGHVINFGEAVLEDGITRCVNGPEE
jgi:GxxExxY protein